MRNIIDIIKEKIPLWLLTSLLSIFTLLAYNIPFFNYVSKNLDGGFNAVWVISTLVVIMLAANYFFYYLILYAGRIVGKVLLSILLILNAASFYFIHFYNVMLTAKMMGNVYNTQYSEASSFFSWGLVGYLVILGVVPAIYLILQKVDYGSIKKFFANIGIAIGVILIFILANFSNFTWIDKHSSELGSMLSPWSYIVNSVRWKIQQNKINAKEILLPEATVERNTDGHKDVCVLIIGESARRANFSLYGYERDTNPKLSGDSVVSLMAESVATYTTAGVKAILDYKESEKLYEPLPNYLYRAGVDVEWRTSNWGEAPLHIEKYYKKGDMAKKYPDKDGRYDGILYEGIGESVRQSKNDKIFIAIHTYTSHGPTYSTNYPKEFEKFAPVTTQTEMSKVDRKELINGYDNTILYSDYLIHNVIDTLKNMEGVRSCVIFISDHGESLGEGNLYMHGVPMAIAPKVQTEIPFIVRTSDPAMKIDTNRKGSQYDIFHSVLRFLGIKSPIYDPRHDIFTQSDN